MPGTVNTVAKNTDKIPVLQTDIKQGNKIIRNCDKGYDKNSDEMSNWGGPLLEREQGRTFCKGNRASKEEGKPTV